MVLTSEDAAQVLNLDGDVAVRKAGTLGPERVAASRRRRLYPAVPARRC